jgi:hypothetical protein
MQRSRSSLRALMGSLIVFCAFAVVPFIVTAQHKSRPIELPSAAAHRLGDPFLHSRHRDPFVSGVAPLWS